VDGIKKENQMSRKVIDLRLALLLLLIPTVTSGLTIGDDSENEVLIIEKDTTFSEDINIINSGQLIFRSADVTFYGSIYISNRGQLSFSRKANLYFAQTIPFQNVIELKDNSNLSISEQDISLLGLILKVKVSDKSSLSIFSSTLKDGELNVNLFNQTDAIIQATNGLIEVNFQDSARVRIKDCRATNIQLPVQPNQELNITYPGADINFWEFPKNVLSSKNITTSLSVDNSSQLKWGFNPFPNSKLTISNGIFKAIVLQIDHEINLRDIGITETIANKSISFGQTGFINLINVKIENWGANVLQDGNLTLTNSTIWRLNQEENSQTKLNSCNLTSTNGLVFLTLQSHLVLSQSYISKPITLYDDATITIIDNTTITGLVNITDSSIIFNLNCFCQDYRLTNAGRYYEVNLPEHDKILSGISNCIHAKLLALYSGYVIPLNVQYSYLVTENSNSAILLAENGDFLGEHILDICWETQNSGYYTVQVKINSQNNDFNFTVADTYYVDVLSLDISELPSQVPYIKTNLNEIKITGLTGPTNLQVFDLSGRTVFSKSILKGSDFYLDTGKFNNGIYFISINYQENNTIQKKVIILNH
jgi:hypothetical protein